jgi:hypothetical protein
MFFDGLVLGDEFALHHAGNCADSKGATHQAGQGSVEGCAGESEDVGGDQCQEGEGE